MKNSGILRAQHPERFQMQLVRRVPAVAVATLLGLGFAACVAAQQEGAPPIPADKEPVVTTDSGLKYSILTPGPATGTKPKNRDMVKVHYTGWLVDGTVFDSSRVRGEPTTFRIGQVIPGWNEGLALMTPGARHKLTIPAKLAYGEKGIQGVIPPNATLVFDVELLEVTPALPEPVFAPGNKEKQQTTAEGLVWEPLAEGAGEPLGPNDGVVVSYAFFTKEGKLLDCTANTGMKFRGSAKQMFVFDEGGQMQPVDLQFLSKCVPLLKDGTKVRLEVPPALGFGAEARGPDLPPNSTTVWEISVDKIVRCPPFALTPADKQQKTASGLIYEHIKEGTGRSPGPTQPVKVHYAGWLTDGTLFDCSFQRADTSAFALNQVIKGWGEGLQLMKEGGVCRFTIPAELAYGASGRPPTIPANSTLVFVVELVQVLEQPAGRPRGH